MLRGCALHSNGGPVGARHGQGGRKRGGINIFLAGTINIVENPGCHVLECIH